MIQCQKRLLVLLIVLSGSSISFPFPGTEDEPRPRLRELGIATGILDPGPLNALTDVSGVRVGHTTLIEGEDTRTGVTAILPHGGSLFQQKVPAAVFAANAFGKAAGFLQVRELGNLETPIVLTNTLCVGTAVQAVVDWTLDQPGNEDVRSVNAVVGETNDGYLNDIRRCAVTPAHVVAAIESAETGPVEEGSVGFLSRRSSRRARYDCGCPGQRAGASIHHLTPERAVLRPGWGRAPRDRPRRCRPPPP